MPSQRTIPGVYQLLIRLQRPVVVRVGALGRHRFAAGWYVYSGSARNGLSQRVCRHLRRRKRKHWHIDYLLAVADQVEAFVLPGNQMTECTLQTHLNGGRIPLPGFGSSDCSCVAHLLYFRWRPGINLIAWDEFVDRNNGHL
jgi:sugar fermentation stimulation protein A